MPPLHAWASGLVHVSPAQQIPFALPQLWQRMSFAVHTRVAASQTSFRQHGSLSPPQRSVQTRATLQRLPVKHESSAQQGPLRAPHDSHIPLLQTKPVSQSVPQQTSSIPPHAAQRPAAQTSPMSQPSLAQQGAPSPPQSTHVPASHASPGWQTSLAQHASSSAPQAIASQ